MNLRGKDAIKFLTREDIGIVVTDYKMPEMSGLEFLREIKKSYPKVPVIIYTGMGDKEIEMEVLKLGASGCLKKPFHCWPPFCPTIKYTAVSLAA